MSSHRWAVVLLGMIVLFSYANSLGNGFVWDDVSSVQYNPYVQHIRYLPKLFVTNQHLAGRGAGNFYRPFVSVSFVADYALWGADRPFGYHLTNVVLHLAVVLCLYAFCVRATGGTDRQVATLAAALYAVLPAHTEAVAYISGRADMMVALFGLGALLALGRTRDTDRPCWWSALSLFLLAGALLSKEMAVIFPVLILVSDLIVGLSPRGKLRWVYHTASFGLVVAYLVLRVTVLWFAPAASAPPATGIVERVATSMQTVAIYAGILLWPVGLHMERTVGPLNAAFVMAGTLIIVAVAASLVWSYRKDKTVLLGLLWAVAAFAPISGMFPLNAPLAEHWLYVPTMGLMLAVAAAGVHLASRFDRGSASEAGASRPARYALVSVAALLVVLMGCATAAQNRHWHDNETLFLHTLRHSPDSARVHYNLAVLYDTQGRLLEAVQQYNETLKLDPNHLEARLDLAALASRSGRLDLAGRLYRQAVTMHPDDPESIEAYVNLGIILYNAGQRDEARRMWDRALSVAGSDPARRAFVERAIADTVHESGKRLSQPGE